MERCRWLSIAGAAFSAAALALVQGCSDSRAFAPTDPSADGRTVASAAEAELSPGPPVFQSSDAYAWFPTFAFAPVIPGKVYAIKNTRNNSIIYRWKAQGLNPGHVYTAWLIAFNNPAGCVQPIGPSPCGAFDLFVNPASGATSMWGGAGGVTDSQGRINLVARVVGGQPPGDVPIGDGNFNVATAHINMAVRDHGPPSLDPDVLKAQKATLRGGCANHSPGGGDGGPYFCFDPQVAALPVP